MKKVDIEHILSILPENADQRKVRNEEHFLNSLAFFYNNAFYWKDLLNDWTLYYADRSLDSVTVRRRLIHMYSNDHFKCEDTCLEITPGNIPAYTDRMFLEICKVNSPLIIFQEIIGARLSKVFLDRVESLFFDSGLKYEVVNVLLWHTLKSMNFELPRAYIETIRDSWIAKNIQTAEAAIQQITEKEELKNSHKRTFARQSQKGNINMSFDQTISFTLEDIETLIRNIVREELEPIKKLLSQEKCPKCNALLSPKHGSKGAFLGCTNFPECKYSKSL
ncbi:topoisomerase DNA-binding C4 zinc finger domain-containing protein [Brevibacillus sp. NPDC003359]|uniref:topoisomerase DNA-binding C4 zinc finger domain-containing protein n=1 Tax=unclassified Brevibacillus TaxID=2684853 RepID=UPI0036AB1349